MPASAVITPPLLHHALGHDPLAWRSFGEPARLGSAGPTNRNRLDELTRRIERKIQGHAPERIAIVCHGEVERGRFFWRHAGQPQSDARPEPIDPPDRNRAKFDCICPFGADSQEQGCSRQFVRLGGLQGRPCCICRRWSDLRDFVRMVACGRDLSEGMAEPFLTMRRAPRVVRPSRAENRWIYFGLAGASLSRCTWRPTSMTIDWQSTIAGTWERKWPSRASLT